MKSTSKSITTKLTYIAFGLLAAFILFCVIVISFVDPVLPNEMLNLDAGPNYEIAGPLTDGVNYDQVFSFNGEVINQISVRTVTWNRNYPEAGYLKVQLLDEKSGNTLYEGKIPMRDVLNNDMTVLINSKIEVNSGLLRMRLSGNAETDESSAYIMRSDRAYDETTFAEIGGKKQNDSFSIKVIGY